MIIGKGLIIWLVFGNFKAFWRKAGISGEFVTNGGPSERPECDRGPLCIVYDGTSAKGNAAIVAFLGGAPAIQWRNEQVPQKGI